MGRSMGKVKGASWLTGYRESTMMKRGNESKAVGHLNLSRGSQVVGSEQGSYHLSADLIGIVTDAFAQRHHLSTTLRLVPEPETQMNSVLNRSTHVSH